MLRRRGGDMVEKGTYWNLSDGNRVDMPNKGRLPGDEGDRFTKLPPSLMVVAGPLLGLLYVIVLPFAAIWTVAVLLGGKALSGLVNLMSSVVSFGWRHQEAHFSGKKKRKNKNKDNA